MSSGYGVDIYGDAYYGYSQPAEYSIDPFVAEQTGYGEITLTWSSPNTAAWKILNLVRSTYGYPASAEDGISLTEIYPSTISRSYDDPGLTPGTIYYYTMFLSLEAPSYASGTTYPINAQVLYSGTYWSSLANGNVGNTPAAGSSHWSPSAYIPTWYPAGYAATLALMDQGYSSLLYNRTPQPYKIITSDTFSNTAVDNPSLQNYLSLFGFGLDTIKGSYDSYLNLNDPDVVSATSLDILGQQLGIKTDYLSTPQQRRQRIKNAAVNYRLKGTVQSIHNLIADLAGWDSVITPSINLMLSPDASAFAHPSYDLWNPNTTYFVNNIIQFNGFNYINILESVGTAQQPSGTSAANTWWTAQIGIVDSTVSRNPMTNRFFSWNTTVQSPGTSSTQGVMTGLPDPVTSANNSNALAWKQTGGYSGGSVDFSLSALLNTPNYSNATNYVRGNYVLYTDGYYYRALEPNGPAEPNGVQTPGVANSYWKAVEYTTSDTPNNTKDTIPLPQLPMWNSSTSYISGTEVQYQGIVYQALIDSLNYQPTGFYYSNTAWAFIKVTETSVSSSAYFGKPEVDATSVFALSGANFYDITGKAIVNTSTTDALTARFIYDYPSLSGTTEPSILNSVNNSSGNTSSTWTSNRAITGLWKSSYGMAYVDPTLTGTTTYTMLLLTLNAAINNNLYVTFATDYADTTHFGHGIVFGYLNSTNFYYTTRKSLYQVVSGTETLLASWTRCVNGDRMLVEASTNLIAVYKYARDGEGTLNLLANATVATMTGTQVGLIQKYSASGAV